MICHYSSIDTSECRVTSGNLFKHPFRQGGILTDGFDFQEIMITGEAHDARFGQVFKVAPQPEAVSNRIG